MSSLYDQSTLALLSAHAKDWTDDLLSRLDPKGAVARGVTRHLTAYVEPSSLLGKRILDFGCGAGSSTLALARLLPDSDIVGVELEAGKVAVANHLRKYHKLDNVRFLISPAGDQLPPHLGHFDVVVLCAVYEHLLPHERRQILPMLWSTLNPGGVLLIGGTPYRWYPVEHHTTGLPFLNYLPAVVALPLAQRFGKYTRKGNWAAYLRAGVRGGSESSILREIGSGRVLQPRDGDRALYWLTGTSSRHRAVKKILTHLFRATDRFLGTVPASHLEIAIRKP